VQNPPLTRPARGLERVGSGLTQPVPRSSFNRALSSLRMCFVEEKTRFDSNDIAKIENVSIAIRVSIDRRDL